MTKGRVVSLQTIHLPQPDHFNIYANSLDQQALMLLRRVMANVRLFKGSSFMVGNQRMALSDHITSLEKCFLNREPVKAVIRDPQNASPGRLRFVQEALPKFPRHDLAELIKEPQTATQKMHPLLINWKPNLKDYETRIVQLSYHMAQRFIAVDRSERFYEIMSDLQESMSEFDDKVTTLQGAEYKNYIETSFNNVLVKFEQQCNSEPLLISADLLDTIKSNDDYHWKHYAETEIAGYRVNSPEGLQMKLIDKNDDYYMRQGRLKITNPKTKGLKLEREGSAVFIKTVARSEEYLQPFLQACDNDPRDDLDVFKKSAHELVFSHNFDYALLAAPVIQFCPNRQMFEPSLTDSENAFRDFMSKQQVVLDQRRRSLHPLADQKMQSNLEIAARALTVFETADMNILHLFDPKNVYSSDFVEKYDKNLRQISKNPVQFNKQMALFG